MTTIQINPKESSSKKVLFTRSKYSNKETRMLVHPRSLLAVVAGLFLMTHSAPATTLQF